MHYVIVGHPTQDKVEDGYVWGGGVLYSGLMAARLGADVTAVVSCRPDVEIDPSITWDIQPDEATTIFENRYDPNTGRRLQIMHARAGDLTLDRVNTLSTPPDILHLAPMANEIDTTVLPALTEHTWLVATPQGWMRRLDEQKTVYHVPWDGAEALLPHLHAIALSDEDVNGDIDLIRHYASIVPFVLYTIGYNGAIVFQGNSHTHIEAEPATVSDPTGAGDTIAAAFFMRLRETNDPAEAVRFGTIAAALAIEAPGTTGIPTREQVEARRKRRLK